MSFDTLYKQNNSGKIQQWKVSIEINPETTERNVVRCVYGQNGGKQQTTDDVILGKNKGKKNETSNEEQALLKAQQLYDKKVKQGYVTDFQQAKEVKNNLAAIEPMLAFPIEKKQKHVEYPAYCQPKLDGFRCIAIIKEGKAKLYSRTQKEITTLPHVVSRLETMFHDDTITLDGELYNHQLKHDFERLAGIIKRDEPHPDAALIQYHIYDCPSAEGGWEVRMAEVYTKAAKCSEPDPINSINFVVTMQVHDEAQLKEQCTNFMNMGYEGGMYRHPTLPYEGKRSAGLLKIKVFEDAEFVVVDSIEGNGKLKGTAGAIVVQDPNNPEIQFKAKLKRLEDANGKATEDKEAFQARCKDWLVNIDTYKGKLLTVKFQGRTVKGVPRFPIGMRLREEI